ncbi:hypothetical protein CVT24_003911 [Panaeolus cyanescens]|uniref:Peptidase M14 domain-containing protein n=1 Tax=Panaeolus cyanescens TaxID=181874 RepID=A0A409VVA8_9AGAR|nr:hypothetical protein CVT24_003911 [Panaeolus cyanescens]
MQLFKAATLSIFIFFYTSAAAANDYPTTGYEGVKVLRIPTGKDTTALDALIKRLDLNVWTHASRPFSHVDVEVPSDLYNTFLSSIEKISQDSGISNSFTVLHDDLGASIRKEAAGFKFSAELATQGELANYDWFKAYHPYSDHLTWLDDLVAAFPNNSRIVSTGTSVEGRDIKGINIFGSSGPETKPAVIWHATVHAREWISSMTVEYLAYSLLNNYHNSTEVKDYVEKYDFYVFPIVNPDGFVYTQNGTRLWRKNRQLPPNGSDCYGRDINRNWNISWAQFEGASTEPCDGSYKGEAPADAPENKGLAAFLDSRANSPAGAVMYVDWHAYSQLFMFPYGFDCDKVAIDNDELAQLASGFASAVKSVHGTEYLTGPSCTTIYPTSGSSADYAYDVSKIKYSFAAELRDMGDNGFIIPPNEIIPSGEETWEGVKYLLANMVTKNTTLTNPDPGVTAPSPGVQLSRKGIWTSLGLAVVLLLHSWHVA